MATKGIAVSTSRFACLKIEDDEDDVKLPPSKPKVQENAAPSKKKNKKKKDKAEDEQLKQLAFGSQGKGGKGQQAQRAKSAKVGQGKSWNQWKEQDTEHVDEQFKGDLEKALLQSRLEEEKKKQDAKLLKERIESGLEEPTTKEGRKKKKQKGKPQTMSLEQFNQLPKEKHVSGSDDDSGETNGDALPPQTQTHQRVPPTQHDPKFFNDVVDDAHHIVKHEKMQEEYRKHYASDNVVVAKLRNDLELKEKDLSSLKEQVETMEGELKQVKKRNKQLCFILGQGEMKEKSQVLLQVEELNKVKDELTDQVTNLTGELEKEKSKNGNLKAEIDKLKGSKHGK